MKRLFVVLLLLMGAARLQAEQAPLEFQATVDRFAHSRDREVTVWWLCDPNSQSRSICFQTRAGDTFEMSLRDSRIIAVELDRLVARADEDSAAYAQAIWKRPSSRTRPRTSSRASSRSQSTFSSPVAARVPDRSGAISTSRRSRIQEEMNQLKDRVASLTQERDQARRELAQQGQALQGINAQLVSIKEYQQQPVVARLPWWFKMLALIVLIASIASLIFFAYAAVLLVRVSRTAEVVIPGVRRGVSSFFRRRQTKVREENVPDVRSGDRRRSSAQTVERTRVTDSEKFRRPIPPEADPPPLDL